MRPKRRSYIFSIGSNTLCSLLNELGGPDKVAEMTGRKTRQVLRKHPWTAELQMCFEKRAEGEGAADQVNIRERKNFQSGKKLVAILSEAASTGISLQADARVGNKKRRLHITLELPWSADKVRFVLFQNISRKTQSLTLKVTKLFLAGDPTIGAIS